MTAIANKFIFCSWILLGISVFRTLYWKQRTTFNKKA